MTDGGRRLRLKVGDAKLDDVGEGRARISPHLMEALDLADGELLRVHGAHPILVSVLPSAPDDEGLDVLRLDATQRRKAGVEIGDVVEAERHEIPAATRVRLVLVGHSGSYEPAPEDLRADLAAQPIMEGDTVSVAPKENKFDAQVNVLGLTVAEVVGGSTDCGAMLARVVETVPAGVVRVSGETEIVLETGGTDGSNSPDDVAA
jgi:hypothetical protein